jgi:hypothetical protein
LIRIVIGNRACVFHDADDERRQVWIFVKELAATDIVPLVYFLAHYLFLSKLPNTWDSGLFISCLFTSLIVIADGH